MMHRVLDALLNISASMQFLVYTIIIITSQFMFYLITAN